MRVTDAIMVALVIVAFVLIGAALALGGVMIVLQQAPIVETALVIVSQAMLAVLILVWFLAIVAASVFVAAVLF